MNEQLKRLCQRLDRMDCGYTQDAIQDLQHVAYELIGMIQKLIDGELKPEMSDEQ